MTDLSDDEPIDVTPAPSIITGEPRPPKPTCAARPSHRPVAPVSNETDIEGRP